MIRLLEPASLEPVEDIVEASLDAHRPMERWLYVNMVSSLDGATAVGEGATPLTDDDDQALFGAMRAACDVILVGAETVRAEDYGPVRMSERALAARRARGLPPYPRLAIVSRRLRLDPDARVFSDADRKPYLLTGADAPADRLAALKGYADVIVAGDRGAEPQRMLDELADRGHGVVLCEGGPTLNAELVELDLVDEIDLAVSATLAGGGSSRIVDGASEVLRRYYLGRVMLGDRMVFLRYLRERSRRPPA